MLYLWIKKKVYCIGLIPHLKEFKRYGNSLEYERRERILLPYQGLKLRLFYFYMLRQHDAHECSSNTLCMVKANWLDVFQETRDFFQKTQSLSLRNAIWRTFFKIKGLWKFCYKKLMSYTRNMRYSVICWFWREEFHRFAEAINKRSGFRMPLDTKQYGGWVVPFGAQKLKAFIYYIEANIYRYHHAYGELLMAEFCWYEFCPLRCEQALQASLEHFPNHLEKAKLLTLARMVLFLESRFGVKRPRKLRERVKHLILRNSDYKVEFNNVLEKWECHDEPSNEDFLAEKLMYSDAMGLQVHMTVSMTTEEIINIATTEKADDNCLAAVLDYLLNNNTAQTDLNDGHLKKLKQLKTTLESYGRFGTQSQSYSNLIKLIHKLEPQFLSRN